MVGGVMAGGEDGRGGDGWRGGWLEGRMAGGEDGIGGDGWRGGW